MELLCWKGADNLLNGALKRRGARRNRAEEASCRPGGTRTPNPLIKSQLLCQIELRAWEGGLCFISLEPPKVHLYAQGGDWFSKNDGESQACAAALTLIGMTVEIPVQAPCSSNNSHLCPGFAFPFIPAFLSFPFVSGSSLPEVLPAGISTSSMPAAGLSGLRRILYSAFKQRVFSTCLAKPNAEHDLPGTCAVSAGLAASL